MDHIVFFLFLLMWTDIAENLEKSENSLERATGPRAGESSSLVEDGGSDGERGLKKLG